MNRQSLAWSLTFLYIPFLLLSYLDVPIPALREAFGLLGSPLYLIAAYIINSASVMGARKGSLFLSIAWPTSFLFEFMGVHYGVPFGPYSYTQAMGPQLLGVPVLIPFLWASLGYFTLEASGNYYVAAAGMVALDMGFDPLASGPLGLWRWRAPGQYFGVPLTNFAGWFVVSLTVYLLFKAAARHMARPSAAALSFYAAYYATWILAAFLLGFPRIGEASLAVLAAYLSIVGVSSSRRLPN